MIRLSGQRALVNLQVVALDQDAIGREQVTWGGTGSGYGHMVELVGENEGP